MRLRQHHAHDADAIAQPGSDARADTDTKSDSCAHARAGATIGHCSWCRP